MSECSMSKIDLYKGDCLEVMDNIEKSSIDLIYIDPPFGIKQDEKFNMVAWKKTDYYEPLVYDMFEKILNENDLKFLSFLYPRLKKMRGLLSEKGSIYVHIDWHVGHYVKILLDDIFGKENFLNEIVWCYRGMAIAKKHYTRRHDVIMFYKKNQENIFNWESIAEPLKEVTVKKYKHIDKDGRNFRLHGKNIKNSPIKNNTDIDIKWLETNPELCRVDYLDDKEGVKPRDWFEMDYLNVMSSERLDFQTQKPEALLERIIKASSNENSIVADFFGGSGTTIAVAKKLGRNGIYCDQNQVAFEIAKKRIEDTVVEKGLFDE